jgi:hypothetical protein
MLARLYCAVEEASVEVAGSSCEGGGVLGAASMMTVRVEVAVLPAVSVVSSRGVPPLPRWAQACAKRDDLVC